MLRLGTDLHSEVFNYLNEHDILRIEETSKSLNTLIAWHRTWCKLYQKKTKTEGWCVCPRGLRGPYEESQQEDYKYTDRLLSNVKKPSSWKETFFNYKAERDVRVLKRSSRGLIVSLRIPWKSCKQFSRGSEISRIISIGSTTYKVNHYPYSIISSSPTQQGSSKSTTLPGMGTVTVSVEGQFQYLFISMSMIGTNFVKHFVPEGTCWSYCYSSSQSSVGETSLSLGSEILIELEIRLLHNCHPLSKTRVNHLSGSSEWDGTAVVPATELLRHSKKSTSSQFPIFQTGGLNWRISLLPIATHGMYNEAWVVVSQQRSTHALISIKLEKNNRVLTQHSTVKYYSGRNLCKGGCRFPIHYFKDPKVEVCITIRTFPNLSTCSEYNTKTAQKEAIKSFMLTLGNLWEGEKVT